MASISYDGQSLQIDGRRLWLVSGSLPYARIPQSQWRDRIIDARNLGLNCIDLLIPWRIHEPAPGKFDFAGQADIKLFIQMLIEQGMWCTLRVGPYVGDGWELGGLPPWLLAQKDIKLRQANPAWLEACSRYLSALLAQVRDLQVTSPQAAARLAQGPQSTGGIVFMQAEHQWLCHNPQQGDTYLREIVRYLRENGCEVPITSCNNLWQTVDGTFDTWCAKEHLTADLRQLAVIQPQAPRIVSDLSPANELDEFMRQLAGVAAAGGQFNVSPLMEGTFDGFTRGRSPHEPADSRREPAIISHEGGYSTLGLALKRVAMFCSHFAPLLAHAQPLTPPVVLSPQASGPGVAILSQQGSQGRVTFLVRTGDHDHPTADLLLPTGLSLPVPLGKHPVAWMGMDINLSGNAQLTLTNLRPWAWIGKRMLVLFGPAGSKGLVTINDTPLTLDLPGAKDQPFVAEHEGLLVVVLNEEQVDKAWVIRDGIVVGAAGVDANDQPMTGAGLQSICRIDLKGKISNQKPRRDQAAKNARVPKLTGWQSVDALSQVIGGAADEQAIDGPRSLEALAPAAGYGWYRQQLKNNPKAGALLACPHNAGRLHFYSQGSAIGVMDGQQTAKLSLKKDGVILAEIPGRFTEGWRMHQLAGLAGAVYTIKPMKLAAAKWSIQPIPSPLSHQGYLRHLRQQPRWTGDVLSWAIPHRRKTPLLLDIQKLPVRVMILINEVIAGVYAPHECAHALQVLLEPESHLKQGSNLLQIACLDSLSPVSAKAKQHPDAQRLAKHLSLYECTEALTDKAELAFTPWELPPVDAYGKASGKSAAPMWHRAVFNSAGQTSLSLVTAGLSHGQVLLNGQNVGRYANAPTSSTKTSAATIHLPTAWLRENEPNELILFDVLGKPPQQCRLIGTNQDE